MASASEYLLTRFQKIGGLLPGKLRAEIGHALYCRSEALRYDRVGKFIEAEQLTFLNPGYFAGRNPEQDLAWVRAPDSRWKYQLNLVKRVLSGIEVSGRSVLEVGSGRGGPASFVARYLSPAAMFGVDRSVELVKWCNNRHRDVGNLHFICGDAMALPFRDGELDVVFCIDSFHAYAKPSRFLREVGRVLRAGGAFCLADHWGATWGTPLWETDLLRCVDFSDISRGCARSMDLNREDMKELLLSCRDGRPENEREVTSLIGIFDKIERRLTAGERRFLLWQYRRVEA